MPQTTITANAIIVANGLPAARADHSAMRVNSERERAMLFPSPARRAASVGIRAVDTRRPRLYRRRCTKAAIGQDRAGVPAGGVGARRLEEAMRRMAP